MLMHSSNVLIKSLAQGNSDCYGTLYYFSGAIPSSVTELSHLTKEDLRKSCVFSQSVYHKQDEDTGKFAFTKAGEFHGFLTGGKYVDHKNNVIRPTDIYLCGANSGHDGMANVSLVQDAPSGIYRGNFDIRDILYGARYIEDNSGARLTENVIYKNTDRMNVIDLGGEYEVTKLVLTFNIGWRSVWVRYLREIAANFDQHDETFDIDQVTSLSQTVKINDPDNLPPEMEECRTRFKVLKGQHVRRTSLTDKTKWSPRAIGSCFSASIIASGVPPENFHDTTFTLDTSGNKVRYLNYYVSDNSYAWRRYTSKCIVSVIPEDMPEASSESRDITYAIFSPDYMRSSVSPIAQMSGDRPIMLLSVTDEASDNGEAIVLTQTKGITEDNYRDVDIVDGGFEFRWAST